jgi:mono/diheme cytochrome c family protein
MARTRFILLTALFIGAFSGAAIAQELFAPDSYADYSADVRNGAQIYAIAGCATCHGTEGDADLLAGGLAISTKFGDLYAPNITSDATAGIGSWTNADFLNAVLHGTAPDGHTYFGAVFPFPSFARMRPEDALDLRAYIAGLPQSDAASKPHDVSFVSQKILKAWTTDRGELLALSDPQMARGQYLVEAVGHCAECHTPRDTGLGFSYDIDEDRAFMGEIGLLGDYAPDITAERIMGFGAEAFVNGALVQARKLNGNPITALSMRRISAQMAMLSVEDRAAIYAYLSGAPLDPASIPKLAQIKPTQTGTTPEAPSQDLVDMTKAKSLVVRVDAYCEANSLKSGQSASPKAGVPEPELTKQADQVIESFCRSCHAPGKTYAAVFPTGDIADMPFDKRILKPGDPDGSPLYESISSNRMPLGQKMSPDEVDVLRRWIDSLAASTSPRQAPDQITKPNSAKRPLFAGGNRSERMLAIATDIAAQPERDRPFMRYMSFANTLLTEIDCSQTGARRNPIVYLHAALNKFINSVSLGAKPTPVTPLGGTEGAIVRLDMRDYGWTSEVWDALTTGIYTDRARSSGFSPEAWADLATYYPYAVDPATDPILAAVADATQSAVPVMRADWFAHFASEAPYYDMFLGLTAQIRDLESRLGVDVEQRILTGQMIRAAMLPGSSGVSDHNRMLERYDLPRGGYYWKSYDFAGDDGDQSLTLHPDGPAELRATRSGVPPFHHDGGEMIFSLPNGLQGYYLSTNKGERLLVGPTSIVSFRNKPIGKGVEIENARSCFDCHANGMIAKRDQMRDLIKSSQRFSRNESETLLDMYVDNDRLAKVFRDDSDAFLTSLAQINATEVSPTGRLTSLSAPLSSGGGEIVTYLADIHFDAIDLNSLAREFHLDAPTLRDRVRNLGDPQLSLILSDWISRLDAGAKLQRSEVEAYYADLLPRLTELRPYRRNVGYTMASSTNYEAEFDAAVETLAKKEEIVFAPAITVPLATKLATALPSNRLQLALSVPQTAVRVNDLLVFDIQANKRCELQVFYVEGGEGIEELPQKLLGPKYLEPGETRRIPFPGSGLRLRFDTAGTGETMLAFCREGGLGDARMDSASVLDYARSRSQPLVRGIAIEAATKVENDAGNSATNFVTFNVRP